MNHNILKIAVISALAFSSCKKDKDKETKEGTVNLSFTNVAGTGDLKMDGTWYKSQHGDSFTVNKFNYYISNLKFNNADGTAYQVPESYYLVEESVPSSKSFDIAKVPGGTYNSITYTIGVDSLRNVSGIQSGALDPANGMFWSWSTGYIMLKVEGASPQSTQSGNIFMLHAGGFKGENNVLRTVTLTLPAALVINGDVTYIRLNADVQKVLGGRNPVSFAATSVIMSAGPSGKAIADNYESMFAVTASGKK